MQSAENHSHSFERIHVPLDARSYDIIIGENLMVNAGEYIAPVMQSERCVVIADESVWALYGEALQTSLQAQALAVSHITVPVGEQSKSFKQLESLLETLLALKIDRKTTLIALGGGIVGDLVGFAASIALRGVPFIQMPTSLLAQVDSAVGGKTAINSSAGKNLVGSFYQPKLVLSDVGALRTLDPRHMQAGYAEIVKYGLIADQAFYAWCLDSGGAICEGERQALTYAIKRSCEMKAQVVASDERESGNRAILNFGHTFAHALEAELQFSGALFHGEAVAVGMVLALKLSEALGNIDEGVSERFAQHLKALNIRANMTEVRDNWDIDQLLGHMASDKKASRGQLNFVVLKEIGNAYLHQDVSADLVRKLLQEHLAK